jgi:cysteine sulfinate desulfinase/cysteine desulfurase-like protein
MGMSPAETQASLRLSLGHDTTAAELDGVVSALKRLVPLTREPG